MVGGANHWGLLSHSFPRNHLLCIMCVQCPSNVVAHHPAGEHLSVSLDCGPRARALATVCADHMVLKKTRLVFSLSQGPVFMKIS